jgi:hypothetical protein
MGVGNVCRFTWDCLLIGGCKYLHAFSSVEDNCFSSFRPSSFEWPYLSQFSTFCFDSNGDGFAIRSPTTSLQTPTAQDLWHTKCMDTGLSTLHRLFGSLLIIFELKDFIDCNSVTWHNFMDPVRTENPIRSKVSRVFS